MAPARRKGGGKTAAVTGRQWKVGDLVLAKVKGFPAWPATVSEPEKWGYAPDWKKVLVYFFGTKQIAFCNPTDVEAFTEEKKRTLLLKRRCKGRDFVRAVDEIIDSYEKYVKQNQVDDANSGDEGALSNIINSECSKSESWRGSPKQSAILNHSPLSESLCTSNIQRNSSYAVEISESADLECLQDIEVLCEETLMGASVLNQLRQTTISPQNMRSEDTASLQCSVHSQPLSSVLDLVKIKKPDDGVVMPHPLNGENCRKIGSVEKSPCSFDFHDLDLLVYSATIASNASEDIGSGITAVDSDVASSDAKGLLTSDKIANCGFGGCIENGTVSPSPIVVLKKKRKQNRKRIISDESLCHRSHKEMPMECSSSKEFSCSHNASGDSEKRYHMTDGDEHLPLVKRARARIGSLSTDEKRPVEMRPTGLEIFFPGLGAASSSFENDHSARTCLVGDKEALNCSLLWAQSDDNIREGRISQQPDCSADGEAVLPPSKRWRRALEAMSANVAEETGAVECLRLIGVSGCTSVACSEESPSEMHGIPQSSKDAFENDKFSSSPSIPQSPVEVSTVPTDVEINEKWGSNSTLKHDCSSIILKNGSSLDYNCGNDAAIDSGPVDTDTCLNNIEDSSSYNEKLSFVNSSGRSLLLSSDDNSEVSKSNGLFDYGLKWESAHHKESELTSQSIVLGPSIQEQDSILRCQSIASQCLASVTDITSACNSPPEADHSPVNMMDLSSLSEESPKNQELHDIVAEDQGKQSCKGVSSSLTPSKILVASSQAKQGCTCITPVFNSFLDDQLVSDSVSSPPKNSGSSCLVELSACGMNNDEDQLTYESRNYFFDGINEAKHEPISNNKMRPVDGKVMQAEANAIWKSFEAAVRTLSCSKESIGQATWLALDGAECGLSGEVVHHLLQNLECESSLQRRMDLFFLVDSIMLCSHSQKGAGSDSYSCEIEAVLSRLLSAVAPPGDAGSENRRQCLKVLKHWLRRNILPEFIIQNHVRELGAFHEATLESSLYKDPSRTSQSLSNVSEIHVDECGRSECGKCSDEGRILESVSSVSDAEPFVKEGRAWFTKAAKKHRHILEDVDGELEMEDVAPACDEEFISSGCQLAPFIPPVPEEKPPSTPPLPISPPPAVSYLPRSSAEVTISHVCKSMHSMLKHARTPNSKVKLVDDAPRGGVHGRVKTYHETRQSVKSANNGFQQVSSGFHCLSLRPPTVSDQFTRPSPRHPYSRMCNFPYQRVHYVNEMHGANISGNRSRIQPEFYDRYGLSTCLGSGRSCYGKADTTYAQVSQGRSFCGESPRSRWSFPQVDRHPVPYFGSSLEYRISRARDLLRPR